MCQTPKAVHFPQPVLALEEMEPVNSCSKMTFLKLVLSADGLFPVII